MKDMRSRKIPGICIFFATVGGCIVGVLIGEKILPYIIITAYGIMYTHMDTVIVPYHFSYAAAASLAALVCYDRSDFLFLLPGIERAGGRIDASACA